MFSVLTCRMSELQVRGLLKSWEFGYYSGFLFSFLPFFVSSHYGTIHGSVGGELYYIIWSSLWAFLTIIKIWKFIQ